jgi:hypothetical protein
MSRGLPAEESCVSQSPAESVLPLESSVISVGELFFEMFRETPFTLTLTERSNSGCLELKPSTATRSAVEGELVIPARAHDSEGACQRRMTVAMSGAWDAAGLGCGGVGS